MWIGSEQRIGDKFLFFISVFCSRISFIRSFALLVGVCAETGTFSNKMNKERINIDDNCFIDIKKIVILSSFEF